MATFVYVWDFFFFFFLLKFIWWNLTLKLFNLDLSKKFNVFKKISKPFSKNSQNNFHFNVENDSSNRYQEK